MDILYLTYFSQTDEYLIRDGPHCQIHNAYCTYIGNTCYCQCRSGYILVNSYCFIGNVTEFSFLILNSLFVNNSNNPSLLFYIKNYLCIPRHSSGVMTICLYTVTNKEFLDNVIGFNCISLFFFWTCMLEL